MGLLGMLAAGGAVGARNASNNNVIAQNELELAGARHNMEMDREMLRQKYLDKRYTTERADAREDAKNSALLNERNYQRTRADKITDAELTHKQKLELEGIKESGRNSRNNARIAASKIGGSDGSGGVDMSKMGSPAGKAAVDLMRLGLAKDAPSAYEMAVRLDIVKAAQQNPMTKIDDDALLSSVQRLSRGLFPREGEPQQSNANDIDSVSFTRDPKTGKLIRQ